MKWLGWPRSAPRVVSADDVARVQVDGAVFFVTVKELVRDYQKNRHADNRMRDAAEFLKQARETARAIEAAASKVESDSTPQPN